MGKSLLKILIKHIQTLFLKIINYINDKILLNKLKKKYNISKIELSLNIQECIICFDELSEITNNYKCNFCSAIFHEKCFIQYVKQISSNLCLQCNQ
jgi:hypothetical protein